MVETPSHPQEEPDWAAFHRRGCAQVVALLLRPPPAALASGKGLLTRAEARTASDWLRPLEQIVRLLLAWTVLLLPPPRAERPEERAHQGAARPRARSTRPRGPAGFRLWGGSSGRSAGAPGAQEPLFSAWRLVARLEAVLAVVEDPAPCLARLARRWGYASRATRAGAARSRRAGSREASRPALRSRVSALARTWLVAEAHELLGRAAALDSG